MEVESHRMNRSKVNLSQGSLRVPIRIQVQVRSDIPTRIVEGTMTIITDVEPILATLTSIGEAILIILVHTMVILIHTEANKTTPMHTTEVLTITMEAALATLTHITGAIPTATRDLTEAVLTVTRDITEAILTNTIEITDIIIIIHITYGISAILAPILKVIELLRAKALTRLKTQLMKGMLRNTKQLLQERERRLSNKTADTAITCTLH